MTAAVVVAIEVQAGSMTGKKALFVILILFMNIY